GQTRLDITLDEVASPDDLADKIIRAVRETNPSLRALFATYDADVKSGLRSRKSALEEGGLRLAPEEYKQLYEADHQAYQALTISRSVMGADEWRAHQA